MSTIRYSHHNITYQRVMKDPASQVPPRTVSPAPTEILDDPPVEDIIANLVAQGIKIRDFASMEEVHKSSLKPVPEMFDPFLSVAEFEYRLDVRASLRWPIPGKTLRRLLEIGWVTPEEVAQRCAPMDINALKTYDMKMAVDIQEGLGVYPWRSLKWTAVPTMQGRKGLMMKYMQHFATVDRARMHLEALERKEKLSQVQAEEEERLVMEVLRRQWLEEKGQARVDWDSLTPHEPFRRSNQAAGFEAYGGNNMDLGGNAPAGPKRVHPSPPSPSTMPRSSGDGCLFMPHEGCHPSFSAPAKQYPAPLSSYDPNVYPDVATLCSRSQRHR